MTRKASIISIASASTQDTDIESQTSHANGKTLGAVPEVSAGQDCAKFSNSPSSNSKEAPGDFEVRIQIEERKQDKAGGYGRIGLFTVNIIAGIIGSQLAFEMMHDDVYHLWYEVVSTLSLLCLAFIMINVGYEFNIDKSNLHLYGTDTLVAMTAAGFPWIFVACWFIWAIPNPLPWEQALVAARFAAPTSAGVLFCMLEAAGLKETWLFKKARVLAIFDDLDTILFMVPLKAILIGFKWELVVILVIVFALLILGFKRLHAYQLPTGWRWTMVYAMTITVITEVVYYVTKKQVAMEAIHIEVLLPAFILGVIIQIDHDQDGCEAKRTAHEQDEKVLTYTSAVFMVLVGLSMPSLFGGNASEGNSEPMSAAAFVGHVVAVSLLMVLGKMFPLACYQKEANLRTRFALAMGMCPRGEVGAGVILISLDLGIKGDAIGIAVICLALNMILTGGFIVTVKQLVTACVAETQHFPSIIPVPVKVSQAPSPDKDLADDTRSTNSPASSSSQVLSIHPPGCIAQDDDSVEMITTTPSNGASE